MTFLNMLMNSFTEILKVGGGAVAVGGVLWAGLSRPKCVLETVEQGEGWADRFQYGSDWLLKVNIRSRGIEADQVTLTLSLVELRDSQDRRIDERSLKDIQLEVPAKGQTLNQSVVIPAMTSSNVAVQLRQVRRLRIKGSLYAWRRFRLPVSYHFDLDMDQNGSFRGLLRQRRVAD